jgi:hypothetical protein
MNVFFSCWRCSPKPSGIFKFWNSIGIVSVIIKWLAIDYSTNYQLWCLEFFTSRIAPGPTAWNHLISRSENAWNVIFKSFVWYFSTDATELFLKRLIPLILNTHILLSLMSPKHSIHNVRPEVFNGMLSTPQIIQHWMTLTLGLNLEQYERKWS